MNIEKLFDDYVSKFDMENPKIKSKIEHSKRVMNIGVGICNSLTNMTQEQVNIVRIICLFHDIGKFDQVKKFDTFDDSKSFDHAGKSVEILFDNGLINLLDLDFSTIEIIKNSIYYHNKYDVPDYLDDKTKFYCSIVRDADKIDIINIYSNEYINSLSIFENPSPNAYEEFKEFKSIKREYCKNQTDEILLVLAFVFDLHFKYSYVQIKDNKYIDNIINNINYSDNNYRNIFIQIGNIMNNYINRKIGE